MKKILIVSTMFFAACGVSSDDGEFTGNDGEGNGGDNVQPDAPMSQVCSKMDILFIIDDSASMSEEQGNLAQNFPLFIDVLNQASDGELDYRVAVTTTGRTMEYTIQPDPVELFPGMPIEFPPIQQNDTGDNGVMRQECGMSRRWLERDDNDLANTFSCVAKVGIGGPALEMPLYATQLALGERISDGTNAGFLREDALLGIVILTDEDDCSRSDNHFKISDGPCDLNDPGYMLPAATINFLDTLTGSRTRWATAVIAGKTDCESNFGKAGKAQNLQDFVSQTGDNAVFSSICDGDLSTPLQEAIAKFDAACQTFDPIE